MAAVLNVLLEVTLYSFILYGSILLFKRIFRKHLSAMLNYALWGLLILRLVLPVTIDSGFRLFVIPDTPAQAVQPGETNSTDAWEANPQPAAVPSVQAAAPSPAEEDYGEAPAEGPVNDAGIREPVKWNIDWQTTLVALWAAGVLGFLAYMTALWRRLHRNINAFAVKPPGYVLELVDVCRKDLGIRAAIDVSVQGWLHTPALCSSLRPRLLLPQSMLRQMDSRQLEFGIRHELIHYRRKDHLVCLLLVLLRCVYWFNPVVWLAFRHIETDMETACDTGVTSGLTNLDRVRYIHTIIDLSGDARVRYILGMGLAGERRSMEKRVRGMFMQKRTKPSVRMVTVMMAAVMLMACFTTACQPTPENQIIQSKDNDRMQEAIDQSDGSGDTAYSYSAPQHWQSVVHDDQKNMDITVDAAVSVPAQYWGIYQLIRRGITREEANTMVRALLGDAQIYSGAQTHSSDDIEAAILSVQAEMAKAKADGKSDIYDMLKEKLDVLQSQLQSAGEESPDDLKAITADLLFQNTADMSEQEQTAYGLSNYGIGSVRARWLADLGKGEPARLNIGLIDGVMNIDFVNNGTGDDFPQRGAYAADIPLRGLSLSLEDARKAARQVVEDLGYGYLDIAAVHTNEVYDPQRLDNNEYPQCYEFTFTRVLDGIPVALAYWNGGLTEQEWDEYNEYAVSWPVREAVVYVDDSGVIGVDIQALKSDIQRLAYGIQLMNLEQIMEIFERQVLIEGCFSPITDQYEVMSKSVYIDEIKLNYMPTIRKDHPDEIVFVPVWDFYGSQVTVYDDVESDVGSVDRTLQQVDGQWQRRVDLGEQSILTINALDGTIMRRNAFAN